MEHNPFSVPEDDNEQSTAEESSTTKKKKRRLKMSLADIVETTNKASEKVEKKRPFSFTLPEFVVKKDDTSKKQEETAKKTEETLLGNTKEDKVDELITSDNSLELTTSLAQDENSKDTQPEQTSPIIELELEPSEPLLPLLTNEKDPDLINVKKELPHSDTNEFQGEITIPHSDAVFFHEAAEATIAQSEESANDPETPLESPASSTETSPLASDQTTESVNFNDVEGADPQSTETSTEYINMSQIDRQPAGYMTDEERQYLLTTAPYQNAQFVNPNAAPVAPLAPEVLPEQQTTIVKRSGFWQGALLGWMFGRRGKKKALEASKLKQVKLEKDKREAEDYASALYAENARQKEALETKAVPEVQAPVEKEKVVEKTIISPKETIKDEVKQEQKTELRTSAWLSYEVNPTTGALVEKSQLEYGPAFEQETKHEAFIEPSLEYDTNTSVLSKTQSGSEVHLKTIDNISPATAEFLKDKQRQELVRFTTQKVSSNITNGSLWALGFVIAVVVIVIILV